MILRSSLLPGLLALGVVAPPSGDPGDPRDRLARISQRLVAGETAAIDELLACTRPVAPIDSPSEAEIERLRQEIARLRAAASVSVEPEIDEPPPSDPGDVESRVREARAWLRAGDPLRCLKALSPVPATDVPLGGEVAYWRGCALERLGRDAEALEQFKNAAGAALSPVMKQAAASGAEHVEWRLRRASGPEASS